MSNETNSKKIKEAFDSIEPAEGAKERMMKNIEQKTAEQSAKTTKTTKVTRILRWAMPAAAACVVVAVCLAIFLPKLTQQSATAGGKDDTMTYAPVAPPDWTRETNPMEEVANPDVFGEKVGVPLEAPEGADVSTCFIIGNTIAQIEFFYGGDGHEYTLRGSKEAGDISGLYGETEVATVIDDSYTVTLVEIHTGDEIYLKIEWQDGDKNFVLMNTDGCSRDALIAIYNAVK